MGVIFWIVIKIETAWRKRSHAKNNNEGVEKEKILSFGRHKRVLLIGVVVAVFLIAGSVYYSWMQDKKEDELACLQRIEYRGGTIYRIDGEGSRNFKTQSEAMNYCLKVINGE